MSGSVLGLFILSPLWVYFCEIFSIRGAFILLSGWYLQSVALGSLFRPLEYYTLMHKHPSSNDNEIARDSTRSCQSAETGSGSERMHTKKFTFELSLFKNPFFTLFIISFVFSIFCFRSITLGIPLYLREKNFSLASISYILSTNAVSDLIGRVVIGFILNIKIVKNYVSVSGFYCLVHFVTGTALFLVPYTESTSAVVCLSVILGFIGGETVALLAPVLLEIIDADKLGNGLGYTTPVYFAATAFAPLLLGKIKQ